MSRNVTSISAIYPTTNINPTYATQHVDHGKYCHIRAHQDYCLELDTMFTGYAFITNIEVIIQIQTPERVGKFLIIVCRILIVWQGITQSNLFKKYQYIAYVLVYYYNNSIDVRNSSTPYNYVYISNYKHRLHGHIHTV